MNPNLQAFAQMAGQGRNGDTVAAHLTQGEIAVPPQLQSPKVMATLRKEFERKGVSPAQFTAGSPQSAVNPQTGMPEYNILSALLPIGGAIGGAFLGGPWGAAAGGAAGGALAGGAVEHGGWNGALLGGALGGAGGYFGGSALGSAFPETFTAGGALGAGAAGAAGDAAAGLGSTGGTLGLESGGQGAAGGGSLARDAGIMGFIKAHPYASLIGGGTLAALLAKQMAGKATNPALTQNGALDHPMTPLDQLPRMRAPVTPANFNPLTAGSNPAANYFPQGTGLPGLGNGANPAYYG